MRQNYVLFFNYVNADKKLVADSPQRVFWEIVCLGVIVCLTDFCPAIATNVFAALRGSGSHSLSYELPACKNSKIFPMKVMPLSRKTARWVAVAAFSQNCPITVFFQSSPSIWLEAWVSPKTKNGISHFLFVRVCNMVFVVDSWGGNTILQTRQSNGWMQNGA